MGVANQLLPRANLMHLAISINASQIYIKSDLAALTEPNDELVSLKVLTQEPNFSSLNRKSRNFVTFYLKPRT
jgi:hypothetical protein